MCEVETNNKEKTRLRQLEYSKMYNEKFKEKYNEYQKKYRNEHKDTKINYNKKYYNENKIEEYEKTNCEFCEKEVQVRCLKNHHNNCKIKAFLEKNNFFNHNDK